MDDLLGEDWQKPAKTTTTAPTNPSAFASNYSSFRASPKPPFSGTASPQNLSRPSSTVNGAKPAATDTFGNLLSLKSQKPTGNVSMQERQKQLLEEKQRQQQQESTLWNSLGSGRGTPEIRQPSPAVPTPENEDDILAAFSRDAPVNASSYFAPPPPSGEVSGRSTPAASQPVPRANGISAAFDDNDDPFGLSEVSKKSNGRGTGPLPVTGDDDDILGDLGRPVTEKRAPPPRDELAAEPMLGEERGMSAIPPEPIEDDTVPNGGALAELIDMGFPADNARIALAENDGNLQNAVGWLLNQAHEESRQKSKGETPATRQRSPAASSRSPQRRQQNGDLEAAPTWMRQNGRPHSSTRRADTASSDDGDKDTTQIASEFGSKLFKSANSIWKASQKQMAKKMAEFQQDGGPTDSSQPKWMRDGSPAESDEPRTRQKATPAAIPARAMVDVTDEAAALDTPRERPQKPPRPSASATQPADLPPKARSPAEPLPQRPASQPKFMQQRPPQPDRRPVAKLSRQDVEEQAEQAYISPARRKRPTPKPEVPPEPQIDLFSSAPPAKAASVPNASSVPSRQKPVHPPPSQSPAPPRPRAPARSIPSVLPSALSMSASHRKAGSERFKRGDYAAAHESYSSALTPLPPTHPIAIIVLTNRALTALKTGDAKVAVSDANRALEIIGPSFGAGETIDLGAGEGTKEMKEFYGKALMRKAEALEHLEKYADAATVWRQAIGAGVGGAVSLRGRDRCEKAAAPKPDTTNSAPKVVRSFAPRPGTAPPSKSLGNSLSRPTLTNVSSEKAVKQLRAANAEAAKEDDEKFALADSVDAKLTAWKGGKADNLRALLQSMDLVLWAEAGWKKVGMSDLVMTGKVKIVYMKAIAKVHPDKIPRDATTEQRMISAAVFSTLNEAWDKFKKDNNLE